MSSLNIGEDRIEVRGNDLKLNTDLICNGLGERDIGSNELFLVVLIENIELIRRIIRRGTDVDHPTFLDLSESVGFRFVSSEADSRGEEAQDKAEHDAQEGNSFRGRLFHGKLLC